MMSMRDIADKHVPHTKAIREAKSPAMQSRKKAREDAANLNEKLKRERELERYYDDLLKDEK